MASLMIDGAQQGVVGVSFTIAVALVAAGETEEPMAWLERAYAERHPLLINAKVGPWVAPVRDDPRFQNLIRRIGFPES